MIPATPDLLPKADVTEYEISPTLTYRLDFANKRVAGKIDDSDAVFQFIQKVLNTDKYAYEIYDWYYGNELKKLSGKPYEYIVAEIPRLTKQALLVDDRILELTDFQFQRQSVDSMRCSFIVVTIYGAINYGMEVNL